MIYKTRLGCKDIWNAFMCDGAEYSKHDIPYCPTILTESPKEILTWEEARNLHKKMIRKDKEYFYDAFICFYIDDYKFEGIRTGIWFFPRRALKILKHFRGIITPDFSTYQDFPYPIKLYNTYRMRAFGYWVGNQGLEVVNNIRWGTEETWEYCWDGIYEYPEAVAIGTVGSGLKMLENRPIFEEGILEMVRVLKPKAIIVYGSSNYNIFEELKSNGISIVTYPGSTSKSYERSCSYE